MTIINRYVGRMIREAGQALEILGVVSADSIAHLDHFSRHRNVISISGQKPVISDSSFVAPTATVVGNVKLTEKASVWYGTVVRGDEASVTIGKRSNIQDDSFVGGDKPTAIGEDVTIGHGVIISSSTIGDRCLIGIKSILDNCEVSTGSIIAAGAVLRPGTKVQTGELWAGNPATFKRNLTEKETAYLAVSAGHYSELASIHKGEDDERKQKLADL